MNKYSVKMLPSMIKSSERTEPSAAGGLGGLERAFFGLEIMLSFFFFFFFFFFCFFGLFRAALLTYGGSQARGPVGATAASLYHRHSNAGSEARL